MAGKVNNDMRDALITAFRHRLCEKMEIVPLEHQAKWWLATDGLILTDIIDPAGVEVQLKDGTHERRAVVERPAGRARVVADLGSFKIGKSFGSGIWAASFAAVPGAKINLVGIEYDTCAPEFDYICEALLSERGAGLKYDSLQNRPRDGKMWLDLPNGVRYEARSWERKDSLKGKEIDAYIYCEAYQLPGLECYSNFSQNLRVRKGYAVFPTTPDRPWVKELHVRGHGGDPRFDEWECVCGVGADANPVSFDLKAKERDRDLMTREKFLIHYEGQLGDFVGSVYAFQRGQRQFNQSTHPHLFSPDGGFVLPDGWELVTGVDTGTFSSAVTVAFSPDGEAFVIAETPNYHYVSGAPELEDLSIPEWARKVRGKMGKRGTAYADVNSQFKREVLHYDIHLLGNKTPLEARTEIAREYFQHGKVWLAPWLRVLPFELENAQWPEEATASGKFARVKDRDHTLDCLEHVLSLRPRGKRAAAKGEKKLFVEEWLGVQVKPRRVGFNTHLGRN